MPVRLLTKYMDAYGKEVSYLIEDENGRRKITAEELINLVKISGKYVSNAILLDDLTFKVIDGSKIDIVYSKDAFPVIKAQTVQAFSSDNTVADYYGREYIKICKLIRKCAVEHAIQISIEEHDSNNGLNVHLFELIKVCNIDLKDFICGYLSVLQPFYLEFFQSKKIKDVNDHVWVLEMGYRTALLIKIVKFFKGNSRNLDYMLVLSFHESNRGGIGVSGMKSFNDKKCAVIVDKAYLMNNQIYVDFTIQKGFLRHCFKRVQSEYKNGVAFVNYEIIDSKIEDDLQSWFRNLATLNTYDNFENLEIKNMNTQLSFAGRGYAYINNLCLLIDLFAIIHDDASRVFLMDLKDNLISKIPEQSKIRIKEALKVKYLNFKGYGSINKMYNLIMEELGN